MKHIIGIIVVIIMTLSLSGCLVPFPQSPVNLPSKPVTEGHPSGTPIDPAWKPNTSGSGAGLSLPSISSVVEKTTPSVVAIQTEVISYDIFLQPAPGKGAGTGIIVDSKGYIVTNNHVVEGAKKVDVVLTDGRTFTATKVNRDPTTDIAVVQIDAKNLTTAKVGRSEDLRVGDWVVAIGNALALEGGPTVTHGIVSYLGRSIKEPNGAVIYDLIQTDAAINPGNSGGPLLNMSGEVVGINTAIASGAENIGFAISITPALDVIQQLIQHGYVVRPWLGVSYTDVNPAIVYRYGLSAKEGIFVYEVIRTSPAEKAGIKPGDVIIQFGKQKITTGEDLRKGLRSSSIGEKVDITYMRGNNEHKVMVTLGATPPP